MSWRLLDLFCGGGGACRGYMDAGFHVTGIDVENQPHYPGNFIRADALEYLAAHGHKYDFIHASPPCQGYSSHVRSKSSRWTPTLGKDEPKLIAATRELLNASGTPWIIENVIGSRGELTPDLMLCGTMFGLPIARHRIFETTVAIAQPAHSRCAGVAKRYAATRGWEYRDMSVTGKGRHAGTTARWQEIMGMHWPLTQHQLAEAIPPAYTRYIGLEIMNTILNAHPQAA